MKTKDLAVVRVQSQLTKAFKELRAQGFIASKRLMCCSGCAGAALSDEVLALHYSGEPLPKGAVYYHKQDAESFSNPRRGNLMIRFGQIDGWRGEELVVSTPLSTEEIGAVALRELKAAGLVANWNGDPDRCIEVVIPKERP